MAMPNLKVMIVEDEILTAMSLQKALEMQGYEVLEPVDTGEEAIKLAKRERPSVVIMDVLLNGRMDGIETARVLQTGGFTRIIFMTGYQDNEILERTKRVKSSLCLVKPVGPDDLGKALDQILDKGKAVDS
ncbi:MAG: hypothetical protein DRH11_07970 [Deltaproteobacteria bacterium]|nr:MAG: hypothetical protein DRH11_07970 [Deltaproteobacteria bacterium]